MTTAIRQINKTPGPVCMECVGYLLEDVQSLREMVISSRLVIDNSINRQGFSWDCGTHRLIRMCSPYMPLYIYIYYMPTFWVVCFAEMEITNKGQCSQQALGCNVSKQEIRSPESEEQLAKAGRR